MGGMNIQLCAFLALALNEGEWSVSCSGHFNSEVIIPDTHCVGAPVNCQ
jgi:hypothetical protein